ncbi:MAG: NUDIX hydrolase [Elusimicrobiota bacterium]
MAPSMVERCVRRNPIYLGKSVNFRVDEVRLPNGRRAIREYMDHPGAVAVAPFLDPDTILLVRQYRYPVGRLTYEIPAGKLDGEESPLRCALRELREETGYRAGRIRSLLSFWPAPAFSNERLHIYVADRLVRGRQSLDEDEFLEIQTVPFQKALSWVLSGKIQDSKTIIALLHCAHTRNRRRTCASRPSRGDAVRRSRSDRRRK